MTEQEKVAIDIQKQLQEAYPDKEEDIVNGTRIWFGELPGLDVTGWWCEIRMDYQVFLGDSYDNFLQRLPTKDFDVATLPSSLL